MAELFRADVLLVRRGLCASRTQAQKAIDAGRVCADGQPVAKGSAMLAEDAELLVEASAEEYVSRGAYKLLGALDAFGTDAGGLVCADIGASTGGFTQVLLKHGAAHVYAVDVGTGQLAELLRADSRVTSIENCNAREMTADTLGTRVDLIVYDVSFISATLLYPAMTRILKDGGRVIGLIKPQFEAGRAAIGKNGIVKHAADHIRSITRCRDAAAEHSLIMTRLIPSPIRGGDGNTEYLCLFGGGAEPVTDTAIRECVRKAFEK